MFALAVVAAVALAACSSNGDGGGAGSTNAASVDGQAITQAQLTASLPLFKFLATLSQAPCGQAVGGESPDAACARFALGNLIQEDLLDAYAAQQNISVPQSQVDSTLKQLETQLGGAAALDTKLKQAGVTRAELTEFAHRLLVFQEVQKKVGEGQTSDAALHQSYEQNKLQFTNLHTWEIVVKTQAQAKKIAKQVTPKNFQTLADKYSIDPSVKQNHGDLGDSAASSLAAPYVQAALALNPGQISQPVQSQFGWHIIRLISSDVQPFDQVKSQLVQQSSGQAFQTWFQNQLTNAKISVNPRYGTFDPSTGTVNAATSTASGSQAPSPGAGGGSGAPAASPQGGSPTP